jgi:hypothetical protein
MFLDTLFLAPTDFKFIHLIHECFVVISSSCIYPLHHIFRFHQETFTAIKSKVRHYIQQIYINVIAERNTTERCKVAKQMPRQFWPNQNKHKRMSAVITLSVSLTKYQTITLKINGIHKQITICSTLKTNDNNKSMCS